MSQTIVRVRNYVPGELIYGRKILNEGFEDYYLFSDEVESAEEVISDGDGNVVLAIDYGQGIELIIVQSIDLEWL